ncbi:hypothetical protein NY2A_b414R [Paramecium bursaria Chlorella virus NY2A]|uniref:Uncharacterized protein b414R n=1 Tax=Paramecium bursaria Chlorella virus NY2A TaxID=46021 RepID=A7IWT9_PBCVN|nr:hypothetical protein NY2A_b414R [Paramecium bursaria Chlorella virus NY2A]YP_001498442.1 hypothetical protein AR158_C361R [Paramecium bursaria Chlorella virus AR158]ABT14813.1 hypothetical protein NY2A_b414R [Paramecium bursaria Chlorella virus NY2A]ABU43906.1 hypothetical protein AR158_C361R [Paramecium bursaria Chlorella virus AR158]
MSTLSLKGVASNVVTSSKIGTLCLFSTFFASSFHSTKAAGFANPRNPYVIPPIPANSSNVSSIVSRDTRC